MMEPGEGDVIGSTVSNPRNLISAPLAVQSSIDSFGIG
jgi:hypothetical protein